MSSASARRIVVAVVAALAGVAWIARARVGADTSKAEVAAVRTATITTGDIQRTIRLSGVVTAERFAALMAPRLRGSRPPSGSGGTAGTSTSTASTSSSSTSSSSAAASSSATSTTSQNSAATSTNTAVTGQAATAGAPGTPTSSLGAIRGTQNRFGDRQAAQNSANTSTTSGSSTSSTALGSSGLGSTSSSLLGTGTRGGSGGGGGDFNLVLLQLAEPGRHVKKGEVVAEFDRQYQVNRLDDYKATVLQQEANIKKMQADLAVAKKAHGQLVESAKADWDKALLDLKTAEVRSAIEAEDLKLAANEAEAHYKELVKEAALVEASQRAQIKTAEIERDQAKLELDRATLNVNRMVVRAPMDGIAVMQTIWRGGDFGQVQLGDQIHPGQTFMQIVDPSSMVLVGNLNQVDTESIRLGLKASAQLDAYPGAEFPARVVGVGAITKPGAWRPNYMREITIRLKFGQIDARVIPDLSASADIVLAAEPHATIAPLSAVFRDGGANPFVFLRTPSGWQRREILVGLQNHVAAAVRSGVSPGDVVAAERPAPGKAPS